MSQMFTIARKYPDKNDSAIRAANWFPGFPLNHCFKYSCCGNIGRTKKAFSDQKMNAGKTKARRNDWNNTAIASEKFERTALIISLRDASPGRLPIPLRRAQPYL